MDLIKMAREMGQALQASDEYKRMDKARIANFMDTELQNGIEEFNVTREKLNEAMQAQPQDDEALKELDQKLKALYTEVMGSKTMMEFHEAKQDVDEIMNSVSTILAASANGEDPLTCEAHPASCGGSCSSCSGGCH